MPPRSAPTLHATHDLALVAAYAAGDAAGAELTTATTLVASCTDCADLHRDLRAIAAAMPSVAIPPRPRDFRLTPEQAAALRPAGWRRFVGIFAGPSFRLAAPLGSGLAALGLAGVLLGSMAGAPMFGVASTATRVAAKVELASGGGPVPAVAPGSATSAPVPAASSADAAYANGSGAGGASGPAPSAAANVPAPSPTSGGASTNGGTATNGGAPAGPATDDGSVTRTAGGASAAIADGGLPVWLMPGALLAMLIGLGLVALRLGSRRLA